MLAGLALSSSLATGLALSRGRIARQAGLATAIMSTIALSQIAKELKRKHENSIAVLIRGGADISARTGQGETPAMLARRLGYVNTANAMKPPPPMPLHEAARKGNIDEVRKRLNAGIDPNARSPAGMTPLHGATRSGRVDLIALLLAAGADPDPTFDGETALHVAARNANIGAMIALLDAGADANADDRARETPLHEAAKAEPANASRKSQDVVRCAEGISLLLEAGSRPEETDQRGSTPLHVTAAGGFPETVTALVTGGAPLSTPNAQGETPLHLAIGSTQWENALALITLGTDPHAPLPDGRTALDRAREMQPENESDEDTQARARVIVALQAATECLLSVDNVRGQRDSPTRCPADPVIHGVAAPAAPARHETAVTGDPKPRNR